MGTLEQLIPPPKTPVNSGDPGGWHNYESAIGLSLPEDYKGLIRLYGTGCFDKFLYLLNPFSENANLNLLARAPRFLDALRELRKQGESLPFPIYPDKAGLFPWGFTENGDVFYWVVSQDIARWPIVLNEARGPLWEEFSGPVSDFLVKLLSGRLKSRILPDDFPSRQPTFCSAPGSP